MLLHRTRDGTSSQNKAAGGGIRDSDRIGSRRLVHSPGLACHALLAVCYTELIDNTAAGCRDARVQCACVCVCVFARMQFSNACDVCSKGR